MNYFDLYFSYPDETITAAWDHQVSQAEQTPGLKEVLLRRGSELFPCFATYYAELRALPRGARRVLQRRIARSAKLATIFPEWLQSGGSQPLQHKLAHSLAGTALLLALGQEIAGAATITVTTNNPRVRPNGQCSLIEAIVNANDDAATHADCAPGSGADTILLPANANVALKTKYDNTYGRTGLPLITSSITIEGNGSRIVRRGSRKFRLMAVSNSGSLTLQDLTLSKGSSTDDGGGVFNNGTLTVVNSTITGNKTFSSGGGVSNRGTLSIDNSTISKNSASGSGGGVLNSGVAEIVASTISHNSAFLRGGGAYNSHTSSLTIIDSIVSDNRAETGGGVFNHRGYDGFYSSYDAGHLSIENSTISGNQASGDGGGVFNSGGYVSCHSGFYCYYYVPGDLSLVDTTISENRAKNRGGGLFHYGSLDASNSAISDNRAPVGPDIFP